MMINLNDIDLRSDYFGPWKKEGFVKYPQASFKP